MRMMFRFAVSLLGACAFCFPAAADDTLRFVCITHGQASDPFWSVVKNGLDAAARDMNVRVEYRAPDTFDVVAMSQLIDAAVASRPDGLMVSIPDADALGDAIRNAIANGIPVVSLNSGSDVREALGVLVHVGQTEFAAGRGAGERMRAAGVTHGLCVNQEVGNVALDLRCEGFAEGLGGTADVVAVSTDPTEIRNQVLAYLMRHRSVDGILTLGPLGADPTLAALEEAGAGGRIALATFDLSPTVLEAIRDGRMLFAIDQQQYLQGYLPVVILTQYAKFGLMPGADVLTGPGFVTRETAAQVIALSARGIR